MTSMDRVSPSPDGRLESSSAGVDGRLEGSYGAAMLDLRHVADHLAEVRERLLTRSAADAALLDPIAQLAERRRAIIADSERKAAERNQASKAMAELDKRSPEFAARRDELKGLSAEA